MVFVSYILTILGVIGLIWGGMMTYRAGRISKTPFVKTVEVASKGAAVAGEKGAVSVEGTVNCPKPLISPVTNTPCLYYDYKVTASWKTGDTSHSKEISKNKEAAPFTVDDGT